MDDVMISYAAQVCVISYAPQASLPPPSTSSYFSSPSSLVVWCLKSKTELTYGVLYDAWRAL